MPNPAIRTPPTAGLLACTAVLAFAWTSAARPADSEAPFISAPPYQSDASVATKSKGCQSCHTTTDSNSMHDTPAVRLGCSDCHGGNSTVALSGDLKPGSAAYRAIEARAHVQPRHPREPGPFVGVDSVMRQWERNRETWSAEGYAEHAAFVPALGAPLVDRLNPQAGERILDVGCGDGILTERIAARGATVIGIDLSESMIAAALARGLDVRLIG